jgi:uncharacterized protein
MSLGSHLAPRPVAAGVARYPRMGTWTIQAIRGDREMLVFAACLVALVVHAIGVALLDAGSVWAALASLIATAVLAAAAVVTFGRGRRAVRAVVAAILGLGALVVGIAVAIPHIALVGAGGSDYTGLLSTVGGVVLVGLALRIALRGRGLLVGLLSTIVALVIVEQWLLTPALYGGLATNAPHSASAPAATLGLHGARDVSFTSSDGVRLSGWYVPGRTTAAVVLLHGSHNTRSDMVAHLRMLSAAGYGVLAYDARGHGTSGGQTNALGWRGTEDLAGAVAFLRGRPGVDPQRIAAVGLSMGAEEALRAAAGGVPLRAVVADGAGASTLGDARIAPSGLGAVFVSQTWLAMRATEWLSGEAEPAPLKSVLTHVRVPTLLIASNSTGERTIDETYRRRIGSGATLWFIPDAAHTDGLTTHPHTYAVRVTSFLAAALGPHR